MKAHDYPNIYRQLGIDLTQMGCIMLPLSYMPNPFPDWPWYKTPDPEKHWIDGWVADRKAHVTLLYGLLQSGHKYRQYIEEIFADIEVPKEIYAYDVGVFDSPYPDENYKCLYVELDEFALSPLHAALELLPHINTFPTYKPHMTLGYLSCDDRFDQRLNSLQEWIESQDTAFTVTGGIDYGKDF